MAKRNYRKSSKKIQPAVLKMNFLFGTAENAKSTSYIDISQCVSLVNRRFYRQGLNWAVAGFKILSPIPSSPSALTTGQISFHKLPNTWVMSNAWEKGFRAWQHMIKNATDDQGIESIKGKFLDFKIYANADHHQAGFADNLLPHSAATLTAPIQTAGTGQWQPSEIELPSTTAAPGQSFAYEIIAVGPNSPGVGASGLNAKSLIGGYEVSRSLPYATDPNTPDDASNTDQNWILGLFNDGTNQDGDVVQMLETTGDRAPYPYEDDGTNTDTQYPGGSNNMPSLEIHAQEYITATTVGSTTRFEGGNFPCGLIEIATFGFAQKTDLVLQMTLVPGQHRGYLAESMTEM